MTENTNASSAIQKVSVFVEGKEDEDLIIGLEEVLRLLKEGFTSGFNRNDTGSFSFVFLEKSHG